MHTLDQYRGTIVTCRYHLPHYLLGVDSLTTLRDQFYESLARLVLAQPHLQLGYTDEYLRSPAFVRLDCLDLDQHVEWVAAHQQGDGHEQYLNIMQRYLDAKFKNLATQPGWKVVVMHNPGEESMEVLYIWNHPHHDGSSGKIFHRQLLSFLNDAAAHESGGFLETSEKSSRRILRLSDPTNTLPPNPEILTSWPTSLGFVVSELWKGLKPVTLFPPGKMHAHWAPIQASPYRTKVRNFTIGSNVVTKVVRTCHLHKTTVTGLIQALCLVSLTGSLPGMEGFASRTPYDLRAFLPANTKEYPWLDPKEAMCNYVSVLDHEFDPELVTTIRSQVPARCTLAGGNLSVNAMYTVWSVAARVRREIQARLESGTHNDLIGIMKYCPDWNNQQRSEMRRNRYLSWLVTNLGVLDGASGTSADDKGAWSLRRAELILSAETPSAALSVSIMTIKDSDMCVTCSWQDCVVDTKLVERLMRDLDRWLNDIGS